MIVCVRTVHVPKEQREPYLAWIEENRQLRERHGILFELVLERSPRQNPAKAMGAGEPTPEIDGTVLVLTAWASHEAFDIWIETPDRARLTASDVHASVEHGPITRHHLAGGYVNIDGLAAVAEQIGEVCS